LLDLGSGGGIDVLLSAKRVGPTGKAYELDMRKVLAEAFRVLKPGGRFAVSDIVVRGGWDDIPQEIKRSVEMWAGCIAGALGEQEFIDLLAEVGFESPSIEPTRVYDAEEARSFLEGLGVDVEAFAHAVKGRFMAAFVRATKGSEGLEAGAPIAAAAGATAQTASACCAPDCCARTAAKRDDHAS